MITYKELCNIVAPSVNLSDALVEGSQHPTWSPNNLRGLFIFDDCVAGLTYVRPSKKANTTVFMKPLKAKQDSGGTAPIRFLQARNFNGLQFLVVSRNALLPGTSQKRKVNIQDIHKWFGGNANRLSHLIVLGGNLPPEQQELFTNPFVTEEEPHYLASLLLSKVAPDPYYDPAELLYNDLHVHELYGDTAYYGEVSDDPFKLGILSPQYYALDTKEGALGQYFATLKNPTTVDEGTSEASDTDIDTDTATTPELEDNPEWDAKVDALLDALHTKNITKLHKLVMKNLAAYAAPPNASCDNPVWKRLCGVKMPNQGSSWDGRYPIVHPGNLLEFRASLDKAWGSDVLEGFGKVTKDNYLTLLTRRLEGSTPIADKDSAADIRDSDTTDTTTSSENDTKNNPDNDKVVEFYLPVIKGRVEHLMAGYDKIFASGYEVKKPYGVLDLDGTVHRVVRGQHVTERSPFSQGFARELSGNFPETDLTRTLPGIASRVLTAGKSVYLPLKMLEFATGSHGPKNSSSTAFSDTGEDWKKYRDRLEKEVLKIFERLVLICTENKSFEDATSLETLDDVKKRVEMLYQSLCTCVLVSAYDTVNDTPVRVKVRILHPTLKVEGNPVQKTLEAFGQSGSKVNSVVHPPEMDEEPNAWKFYDFTHEPNGQLSMVEPVFAYTLLDVLKSRGEKVSSKNILLGLSADERAVGSKELGFNARAFHAIIAGSRSGKGVLTQAVLAGNLLAQRPIFLVDNKPDMASMLRYYSSKVFAINGSNLGTNNGEGTDMFGAFNGYAGYMEGLAKVPDYLPANYRNYSGMLGRMAHLRGVQLVMGILLARMNTSVHDQLGGSDGILAIFDELSVSNGELSAFIQEVQTNAAPLQFSETSAKGISEYNLWLSTVYKSLSVSCTEGKTATNAGFKNGEASRSDVFVITQDPLVLGDSYKVFPQLNKTRPGFTGRDAKFNEDGALEALIFLTQADALVGYHDQKQYLQQASPDSKAYGKLSAHARMFGYLSDYSADTERILRDNPKATALPLADKAKYFRPGLIYAKGGRNDPPWRNMVDNVWRSSLGLSEADIASLEQKYSDPNNPAENVKGIGFEGFLEEGGLSRDQMAAALDQSGIIAQRAVTKLGYPGTWEEFLVDLRPEWVFTPTDLYEAFRSDKGPDYAPYRFWARDNDLKKWWLHFEVSMPEKFGSNAGVNIEEAKVQAAFADFDMDDDEDEYTADASSSSANAGSGWSGYTSNVEGAVSPEQYAKNTSQPNPESPAGADNANDSTDNGEGEVVNTEGDKVITPEVLSKAEQIGSLLRQMGISQEAQMRFAKLLAEEFPSQSTQRAQSTYNYNPQTTQGVLEGASERLTMQRPSVIDSDGVQMAIIAAIRDLFGGFDQIRRIHVNGGALIINGMVMNFERPEWISQVGITLARGIRDGQFAELISWSWLTACPNLVEIGTNDPMFAEIAWNHTDMGKLYDRSGFNMARYFNRLPNLKGITLGAKTYMRKDVLQGTGSGGLGWQHRSLSTRTSLEDWLYAKSKSSWDKSRELQKELKNSNRKVMTSYAGTAALAGTGAAVTTTRALANGTKSFVSGFLDAVKGK